MIQDVSDKASEGHSHASSVHADSSSGDKASESHSHASSVHDDSSSGASSQEEGSTTQMGENGPGSSVAVALAEEQDVWGGVMDSQDAMTAAVQAAALFPDALRISSVTQDGIQKLQLAVMHLLSSETEKAADPPIK